MKKIIVIVLLLLIVLLFLYAAHLDGFVHIRAMAFNQCEFCEFINDHDLDADLQYFPQNEIGAMKEISYELVLNAKLIFGHDRSARKPLVRNIELNYCPECGRRLK